MDSFFIVLEQVGLFAVYMSIGVIAVKSGLINSSGLDVLSVFVTRIALPLLVFTNIVNGCTREDFMKSWIVIFLTVIFYIALFTTAVLLKKLFRMRGNRGRVYHACSMFGNAGFIGIPVITALLPARGMLYIALFTVPDMLILWTLGVYLTTPENAVRGLSAGQVLKKMINPTLCATVLSVLFVFFKLPLPGFIGTALTRAGAVATPLALIYLGGVFCFIHIGEFVKRPEIFGMIAVKMVLLPVLLFFLFSHIPGTDGEIALAMSMLAGMPVMTTITMLAHTQGSDGDYAAGMIFLTTIASIVTLPLVSLLIG